MKESRDYHYLLEGERIYLREVRLSDVNDNYYKWMNDIKVTQYLESRFYPNSMESLQEYVKSKQENPDEVFWAIIVKKDDTHIGNVKLGPIDWIHRLGDIGILIGDKNCWGKGYASEVIDIIVQYGFKTLNLHKLTAGNYSTNRGATKIFEKSGFKIEGILKQHCFCNGEYVDVVLLGLLNNHKNIK